MERSDMRGLGSFHLCYDRWQSSRTCSASSSKGISTEVRSQQTKEPGNDRYREGSGGRSSGKAVDRTTSIAAK